MLWNRHAGADNGSGVGGWGTSLAELGPGADCLQRPLRSRFRQQLRPGVAMTSHVKSGLAMVWHFLSPVSLRPLAEAAPGRHDG